MSAAPAVIRLVPATVQLLDAALAGDDTLSHALGHEVASGWASFRDALQAARDGLAEDPARGQWGARLFVTDRPPQLVGWGGFKGPPDSGVVELGYEIAASLRSRGLATAAARAMVGEAFADQLVQAVIAHTLPERNASNRVLEKVGFRYDGEDRENGQAVWRFRRDR